MPDLSSYIDFSVRFDLTTGTPTMILTDTSSYPSGVEEDITGYFSITSPDMGTDSGSWSSPDVTWNGDELTTKELILRLNDKGNIQAGDYTVVYNVHHPDYTPTVLSRTFNTSYVPPKLNLVNKFDVFTPSLKYQDQTNYGIPGYSLDGLNRLWQAFSIPSESISDDSIEFDINVDGQYYDAEYEIYFSYSSIYISDVYSYLTIEDFQEYTLETSANTPPSIDELVGYLNDLKDELDANVNNDSLYSEYKSRYEYASSLLFNIKESCRVGLLTPLSHYVSEFLSITNNFVTPPYTNTDEVIEPYDCGSAGAASTYKVYTALLSQSGTNAPVATVLENTLGGTVVWAYSSTGSYSATLAGAFPANKLFFIVQQDAAYNNAPQQYNQKIRSFTRVNNDIVFLSNAELNFTAGAFTSAGYFNNFSNVGIEIRVYN
jgi:hypothetical protein